MSDLVGTITCQCLCNKRQTAVALLFSSFFCSCTDTHPHMSSSTSWVELEANIRITNFLQMYPASLPYAACGNAKLTLSAYNRTFWGPRLGDRTPKRPNIHPNIHTKEMA